MHATTITHIELMDVDIPLITPFGIATGAQVVAQNLFVRLTLRDGTTGCGEAAPFPAVNGETRAMARAALAPLTSSILGRSVSAWRLLCAEWAPALRATPSALCALETAILDALCRHHQMPMHVFFGGHSTLLRTDLTITTGTLEEARASAASIAREGYDTIKLKVGGAPLAQDVARLQAVAGAAPGLGLIIDANGGMADVESCQKLLLEAAQAGARVVLFEQPLPKADLEGMAALTRVSTVPIAADEAAGSVQDVVALARAQAAHVINIKLTKCGVVEAVAMAQLATSLGLGLMMGGMVESRLCAGMSACVAAGLGGFGFVDLDTPLWLVESPVQGGYQQHGPALDVSPVISGHGCTLALEHCRHLTVRP